jgi:hypothetical protein
MSGDPEHLAHARKVADAILYEGYLLYPYHGRAAKNQARFQFGVLMPPGYADVDPNEPSASQTECLAECGDDAQVRVLVRFLQLRRRSVAAAGPDGELEPVDQLTVGETEYVPWDEATEREQWASATAGELCGQDRNIEFHIGAGAQDEPVTGLDGSPAGQLSYRWDELSGVVRLEAQRVAGPYGALRLRVRVENHSAPADPPRHREEGLRTAMIGAHVLIWIPGGRFLSMTDPPEWAAPEVAACTNIGTWPVLAGPADCQDLLLSSPVILYDHPEVAAESAGDLFDATEIDEILTLRTLALTDTEKQQARATDPKAAELLDRLDGLPPEMLERMHGAIRYLESTPARPGPTGDPVLGTTMAGGAPVRHTVGPQPGAGLVPGGPVTDRPAVPWWDPGADQSVSPETDHITVAGLRVARGSRVVMRPGSRRADAQDLFLAGREAVVDAVLHDVDGQVHVAVTPCDDPAADLQRSHGRFLYFAPDEIEPLPGTPGQPAEQENT